MQSGKRACERGLSSSAIPVQHSKDYVTTVWPFERILRCQSNHSRKRKMRRPESKPLPLKNALAGRMLAGGRKDPRCGEFVRRVGLPDSGIHERGGATRSSMRSAISSFSKWTFNFYLFEGLTK